MRVVATLCATATRPRRVATAILVSLALTSGCAAQNDPADQAAQQVAAGRALYATHCARCHGDQGQGKRGPPLIGPRHGLRGYGTAEALFLYTRRVMPFDTTARLADAEYWAILAFMLQENQLGPAGTPLDAQTAPARSLVEATP